jgi:hypothetical protein
MRKLVTILLLSLAAAADEDTPMCSQADGEIVFGYGMYLFAFQFNEISNPPPQDYTEVLEYTKLSRDCQMCLERAIGDDTAKLDALNRVSQKRPVNPISILTLDLAFRQTCFTAETQNHLEFRYLWSLVDHVGNYFFPSSTSTTTMSPLQQV